MIRMTSTQKTEQGEDTPKGWEHADERSVYSQNKKGGILPMIYILQIGYQSMKS